eukprot:COSAG01_NODE_21927_length_879_cov_1.053846_1_plen_29_part_10
MVVHFLNEVSAGVHASTVYLPLQLRYVSQ